MNLFPVKLIGVFVFLCLLLSHQNSWAQKRKIGIVGKQAPEWKVQSWIDAEGNPTEEVKLSDYEGKVVFMLTFQSWCPGCHRYGFPTLQKTIEAFEGNDEVAFVSVQTVFEGASINTVDKVKETQERYDLKIPMGHDVGDASTRNRSHILTNYRTGGTPWIILIDQKGKVVFNDYHINADEAIAMIKGLLKRNKKSLKHDKCKG